MNDIEKQVLKIDQAPATEDQLYEASANGQYISGIVEVEPSDLIDHDYEGFLDLVSERLVGGDLLMDSTYEVVGWNPETKAVKYQVTGDPSSTYEVNVSTVECQICHREAPASSAHLHGDGQVCVLCWDDRLKSSE
jgi:hypothetical protein